MRLKRKSKGRGGGGRRRFPPAAFLCCAVCNGCSRARGRRLEGVRPRGSRYCCCYWRERKAWSTIELGTQEGWTSRACTLQAFIRPSHENLGPADSSKALLIGRGSTCLFDTPRLYCVGPIPDCAFACSCPVQPLCSLSSCSFAAPGNRTVKVLPIQLRDRYGVGRT